MSKSMLEIHDELLSRQPEGSRHETDICPFCTDWALDESGIPSGYSRLDLAEAKAPYGNVEYADPGYLADKVKRYPIDTEAHARAAWSYIHKSSNAERYSAEDLAKVRSKISSAMEKFGAELDEKQNGTQADKKKPTDKSSEGTNSDAVSEGGTTHMETLSKETHDALLAKAVADATDSLKKDVAALQEATEKNIAATVGLTDAVKKAEADIASLTAENERLNGELDTAQVSLKAAQDEAAALKDDLAARDEAAEKATVASDRAAQVRNLGLFTEDYINDKASKWADVDEAAWNDRVEEWKALKAPTGKTTTDTASAMSGTSDAGTGHSASARRAILGLQ